MNKTVSINIAGIIFIVNEDAYEILKKYLEELHLHFSKTEEGKEVYIDIEGRIAEIFSEIITSKNQVITIIDVENLISTLGKVEDLTEEDEENEENKNSEEKPINPKKRLYRDIDDKAIGGVAKGLSYYLGIDVIIIRIIFVLLLIFGGSGFWIYIILWIAMPEAKTTVQKLEMKGEPINLSNLEKNINDEFNKVKENFKNKKYHKGVSSFFDKLFDFFITIIKGILRAFSSVLGVSLIIIGALFLSIIVSSFLFDNTLIQINNLGIHSLPIRKIINFFTNDGNISMLILGLYLIIGIPILSILYFGVKLIFRIKFHSKIIAVISIILWIFGIVIFTVSIGDISKEFRKESENKLLTNIETQSDTLYIKNINVIDSINSEEFVFIDEEGENGFTLTDNNIYIKPDVDIIDYNTDTIIKIEMITSSRGRNKKNAKENISKIDYNWKIDADTMFIDSHYKIDSEFRAQEVKLNIYKPQNKTIIYNDF